MRDEQRAAAAFWALGDYAQVGARLRPAASRLAEAVGDGHGRRALDVATGTGSVALELAARGWAVSATDLCEPLVAQAVSVARQAGRVIDFRVAALDEQPHEDAAFAAVTSSFGLIFAPDPGAAVDEVVRCLQPGGLLAFTVWLPRGYLAEMTRVMQQFLPPAPAGGHDPLPWGDPEVARARLADLSDVRIQTEQLPWEFRERRRGHRPLLPALAGPRGRSSAAGDAADELRLAVYEHLAAGAGAGGEVRLVADYALVLAHQP